MSKQCYHCHHHVWGGEGKGGECSINLICMCRIVFDWHEASLFKRLCGFYKIYGGYIKWMLEVVLCIYNM